MAYAIVEAGKSKICSEAGTLETQVQSLGQKEPLEKEMATHSSILAWRIPRTEEPGELQSMGLQRVGHNWAHQEQKGLEALQTILEF